MESVHPLKAFRENREPKLSQEQLADLLGVSRVTVTRWESGARKLDFDLVSLVSEKTGIPARELRPDLAELMGDAPDEPLSLTPAQKPERARAS